MWGPKPMSHYREEGPEGPSNIRASWQIIAVLAAMIVLLALFGCAEPISVPLSDSEQQAVWQRVLAMASTPRCGA